MRAHFARKLNNIEELREFTAKASRKTGGGAPYVITKEISLGPEEFKAFSEDFFADQTWLTIEDGGPSKEGMRCTRVINSETGEAVLVNNEGYSYARYTALEN